MTIMKESCRCLIFRDDFPACSTCSREFLAVTITLGGDAAMSAGSGGAPREVFRLQSSAVPKIAREGDEWAGVDAREGSSLYRGAGGDEMSGAGACGHAGGTEG